MGANELKTPQDIFNRLVQLHSACSDFIYGKNVNGGIVKAEFRIYEVIRGLAPETVMSLAKYIPANEENASKEPAGSSQ